MSCRLTYSITETWAFGIASVHRRLLLSLIGQCYVQVTSPRTPFFLHQQLCITKNGKRKTMETNNEEDLEQFSRLLERLRQAGFGKGGNVKLVFVAKGAQHVENQYNIGKTLPGPPCLGREESGGGGFPGVLSTEAAMALWKKVQQAGYVDENYQSLLSRTQSALLADAMARRLGIRNNWKVFETLWNRKNMRGDYNDALNQRQSLKFRDKLKIVLAD